MVEVRKLGDFRTDPNAVIPILLRLTNLRAKHTLFDNQPKGVETYSQSATAELMPSCSSDQSISSSILRRES